MLRRAVLLPVIGAAIIGAIFLAIIQQLLTESERLRHTEEVIATAEQIRELAVDMETGVRGYLLTHDRRFLAHAGHIPHRLHRKFQIVAHQVHVVRLRTVLLLQRPQAQQRPCVGVFFAPLAPSG